MSGLFLKYGGSFEVPVLWFAYWVPTLAMNIIVIGLSKSCGEIIFRVWLIFWGTSFVVCSLGPNFNIINGFIVYGWPLEVPVLWFAYWVPTLAMNIIVIALSKSCAEIMVMTGWWIFFFIENTYLRSGMVFWFLCFYHRVFRIIAGSLSVGGNAS